jgi:MacB-like periplasmic core domain
VLVIGYELWQRVFGGDPGIVGRSVLVNARAFTVVGVAGEGFKGTRPRLSYEAWAPIMMQEWLEPGGSSRLEQRGNSWLSVLGRLAPGASFKNAETELRAIGLLLAVGLGPVIKGLVPGVSPWDPLTLVAVLLVLGGSSVLACLAPAWRAASTDPVKALRAE